MKDAKKTPAEPVKPAKRESLAKRLQRTLPARLRKAPLTKRVVGALSTFERRTLALFEEAETRIEAIFDAAFPPKKPARSRKRKAATMTAVPAKTATYG